MKVRQITYDEMVQALSQVQRQRNELLAAAKALLHSVTEGAIADALTLDAVRGYGKEDAATIKAIADVRAAIAKAEGGK